MFKLSAFLDLTKEIPTIQSGYMLYKHTYDTTSIYTPRLYACTKKGELRSEMGINGISKLKKIDF